MNVKSAALSVLAASLVSSAAGAAPTVFFGENLTPGGGVSGAPVTARNSFLLSLNSFGTETFEGFPNVTGAPLELVFPGAAGGVTGTLTSGDAFVYDTVPNDRYNTTAGGKNYLEVSAATFTITFSRAISAFGFYGTDIGDFNGQLTLHLDGAGGGVDLTVPHTVDSPDGALLFYGFIDSTAQYTSITFGNTTPFTEVFGFDDMIVGDPVASGAVPEPGTLALTGIALAGLLRARKRKGSFGGQRS